LLPLSVPGCTMLQEKRQQAAALQSPGGSPQDEKGAETNEESPHALLYKFINFLILVGALGYLLRKPLADFFRQRAQTITESIQQGRHALAAAQSRLSATETKLANLESEIRAFKESAAREMETEFQRLRQAAREESERTLAFARLQMEMAARAAALELKRYTALEAVNLAEGIIRQRLEDQGQRRLVSRFIEGLAGSHGRAN
jgi:F-type H+-transporting ATPase subunit b